MAGNLAKIEQKMAMSLDDIIKANRANVQNPNKPQQANGGPAAARKPNRAPLKVKGAQKRTGVPAATGIAGKRQGIQQKKAAARGGGKQRAPILPAAAGIRKAGVARPGGVRQKMARRIVSKARGNKVAPKIVSIPSAAVAPQRSRKRLAPISYQPPVRVQLPQQQQRSAPKAINRQQPQQRQLQQQRPQQQQQQRQQQPQRQQQQQQNGMAMSMGQRMRGQQAARQALSGMRGPGPQRQGQGQGPRRPVQQPARGRAPTHPVGRAPAPGNRAMLGNRPNLNQVSGGIRKKQRGRAPVVLGNQPGNRRPQQQHQQQQPRRPQPQQQQQQQFWSNPGGNRPRPQGQPQIGQQQRRGGMQGYGGVPSGKSNGGRQQQMPGNRNMNSNRQRR